MLISTFKKHCWVVLLDIITWAGTCHNVQNNLDLPWVIFFYELEMYSPWFKDELPQKESWTAH